MVKFELLPNEMLLKCFGYLNGIDIYHAFNGLNSRFNNLIQNSPLYINFQHIKYEKFNRFCTELALYPSMKNQIFSLHLSDAHDTYGQLEVFLRTFQLNEFIHLQSLTLVNIISLNAEEIIFLFASLSNLQKLVIIELPFALTVQEIVELLPTLKILSIPELKCSPTFIDKIVRITHLTVTQSCDRKTFKIALKHMPILKYFKIGILSGHFYDELEDFHYPSVYLTELIIGELYLDNFLIEPVFRNTPNLKTLTLSVIDEKRYAADHWENMISLLLPQLQVFNFTFDIKRGHLDKELARDLFMTFQTDFWHKQHQWYTAYELRETSIFIFTIPYYFNTYKLESDMIMYYNPLISNSELFKNVTQLEFIVQENLQSYCYFSNIKSLRFGLCLILDNKLVLGMLKDEDEGEIVQFLKTSVYLTNLEHLEMNVSSPVIFLSILKETPNLSSITIHKDDAMLLSVNNSELRKYLNRLTKKLNIYDWTLESNGLADFCKTFSNLEQLQCSVRNKDDLIFLLEHLPKLSCIKVKQFHYFAWFLTDLCHKLQEVNAKLKKKFLHKSSTCDYSPSTSELYVWLSYNN